ncbi:ankyrin repeat domain-containing protein [filamentous cyanobacterium LEGE 11480]|uniref:Ankyrin repeat domain-containing protein n=1 Tax=Romeriopsis navalis LEGE 11480 TaxID=2777977 RepID=A0A928Z3U3_9CYAN|nr:ankyrin repeat domain-containing protein [Romeriopsis navalis]MBE9030362.1 ankyrin repeat domain-containing protein [Romeriopsis navalis LEGE 11480]
MKAFVQLMGLLTLIAAGMTLITGSLNAIFDWDLGLKIGGSSIPLPPDFFSVVAVALLLVIIGGLFFLIADAKRVFRFIRRYRWRVLIGLATTIAVLVIGFPYAMPNLSLELAVQEGDSAKAQAMLDQRQYPTAVLNDLTYWSLKNQDFILTKKMLDRGADINHRRGEFKSTLLDAAVHFFDPSATEFLIQQGIDLNAQDSLGRTALHTLITYRRTNVTGADEAQILALVKQLVTAGANPKIENQAGKTPLQLAQDMQYNTIVEFLK